MGLLTRALEIETKFNLARQIPESQKPSPHLKRIQRLTKQLTKKLNQPSEELNFSKLKKQITRKLP